MKITELSHFQALSATEQLESSEIIASFRISFLHALLNPPFVVLFFIGNLTILIITLKNNNFIGGITFGITALVALVVAIFRGYRRSSQVKFVAVYHDLLGLGGDCKMHWFHLKSIVNITWAVGNYCVIHLESGHQHVIPKATAKNNSFITCLKNFNPKIALKFAE